MCCSLGTNDDNFVTNSIPRSTSPNRTTTTVHAGMGNDILIINLPAPEHEGCVFVANGQDGDDTIDASGSTLQMIIFGDGGSDELRGGQSEDVLIGDYGLVTWIDENGI